MNSNFLRLFVVALSLGVLIRCSRVTAADPSPIQYGGACSPDFSQTYETILNSPEGSDIQSICDDFYARFSDVKCMSKINGVELRLHTTDFDRKCLKIKVSEKINRSPVEDPVIPQDHSNSVCTHELTSFLMNKQTEFQKLLDQINTNTYSDDQLFEISLDKKKICSQYFFNYKYAECALADKVFSFYSIKTYCDQFQDWLYELKIKNPKKYSPQELEPLTGLSLKFHFVDALLPFYKTNTKVKDTYIVDGGMLAFNHITSSQNYCFFESEKIRFAGELKNQLYKVDVAFPNKHKVTFTYSSFNEQWKLVCRLNDYFYYQDLMETLGDHVSVIE